MPYFLPKTLSKNNSKHFFKYKTIWNLKSWWKLTDPPSFIFFSEKLTGTQQTPDQAQPRKGTQVWPTSPGSASLTQGAHHAAQQTSHSPSGAALPRCPGWS